MLTCVYVSMIFDKLHDACGNIAIAGFIVTFHYSDIIIVFLFQQWRQFYKLLHLGVNSPVSGLRCFPY